MSQMALFHLVTPPINPAHVEMSPCAPPKKDSTQTMIGMHTQKSLHFLHLILQLKLLIMNNNTFLMVYYIIANSSTGAASVHVMQSSEKGSLEIPQQSEENGMNNRYIWEYNIILLLLPMVFC